MDLQPHQPQQRLLIDLSAEDEDIDMSQYLNNFDSEDEEGFEDANEDPLHLPPPARVLPPQQPANPEPLRPFIRRHDSAHEAPMAGPHNKKDECLAQISGIFPDICPKYLEKLYTERAGQAEVMLAAICEGTDNGKPYPKREQVSHGLKRKRELTAAEEAQKAYGAADREDEIHLSYYKIVQKMLSDEFSSTPKAFINRVLQNRATRHLFHAYKVLAEAERTFFDANPKPYKALNKARPMNVDYFPQSLDATISNLESDPSKRDELKAARELSAARKVRQEDDDRKAALNLEEEEERLNKMTAERDGTMQECGCCFDNYPLNRMVHCNSDENLHWFCRGCAKQMADNVIGNHKHELICMSMDGCSASFSRSQLREFLDDSSIAALERHEQEDALRMAGIENLVNCPFCFYAAECPPVEEDKEFRCENPECRKVSCRLCSLETHIPKSCAENKRENAPSIRLQIEEAMTAAIIRKCNKCSTPFIKDYGCNKMTCMQCRNVQCYVCSKSCDYQHFDDSNRGGKAGNCKLFDNVEERHEEEAKKAENDAINKVRMNNPQYTEDQLRIHVSDNVKKDDEKRKASNPQNPQMYMARPPGVPGAAAAAAAAAAAPGHIFGVRDRGYVVGVNRFVPVGGIAGANAANPPGAPQDRMAHIHQQIDEMMNFMREDDFFGQPDPRGGAAQPGAAQRQPNFGQPDAFLVHPARIVQHPQPPRQILRNRIVPAIGELLQGAGQFMHGRMLQRQRAELGIVNRGDAVQGAGQFMQRRAGGREQPGNFGVAPQQLGLPIPMHVGLQMDRGEPAGGRAGRIMQFASNVANRVGLGNAAAANVANRIGLGNAAAPVAAQMAPRDVVGRRGVFGPVGHGPNQMDSGRAPAGRHAQVHHHRGMDMPAPFPPPGPLPKRRQSQN